jgi:predicted acylesterase/phospholipase RssA
VTTVERPFRVLSLDGGGMRGIYTAQYLASLADGFSKKSARKTLDVGSGFDLIVGTSTGAILACALAANIPLSRVVQFYNQKGAAIFERRIPSGIGANLLADLKNRPAALRRGNRLCAMRWLSVSLRRPWLRCTTAGRLPWESPQLT